MMNRFFTLLFAASCLTAVGQVPDYLPTDGLVAWYPFNGNANDESGNANHGAVNGAVLTDDRFGATDAAYFFNDQSSISSMVNNAAQGDAAATLVGWGYLDLGNTDVSYMVGYGGDPEVDQEGQFFAQGEYGTSGIFATASGSSYDVISDVQCPLNEWFHIASVLSNSEVILYLNGEVIFEKTITQPDIGVSNGCWIGSSAYYGGGVDSFWQGSIDDIGIWNRAITEEEVSALYNATSPNAGCSDLDACNFDNEAVLDDGSCHFNCQFCHEGTVWSEELGGCVPDNPSDLNHDGCVDVNDFMGHLAAFGAGCDSNTQTSSWQCGDPLGYQGYDYETVQIEEQCWFAENLRAQNYRNGDAIPTDLSDSEWAGTAEGAKDYGPLGVSYNGFAVVDGRQLCPIQWHVSLDADWIEMETFLGMDSVDAFGWRGTNQGTTLKSTTGWSNDGNGTDAVGFSARPESHRQTSGSYIDELAIWWCLQADALISRNLNPSNEGVYRYQGQLQNDGLSVRCIKDAE